MIGEINQARIAHQMVPVDGHTLAIIGGASRQGNRTSVEMVEIRTEIPILVADAADPNAQQWCPIMQSDFVSAEDGIVVSFNGVEVLLCCELCEERWKSEPEAYLNVAVLPQLREEELPPRKIEQVYCPVYRERVVSSQDPTLEHEGRTLYFFSSSARRRFAANPDKYPVNEELFHWKGPRAPIKDDGYLGPGLSSSRQIPMSVSGSILGRSLGAQDCVDPRDAGIHFPPRRMAVLVPVAQSDRATVS